ncbi:hypothetical protein IQ07DRAFT_503831 [Pyrenochaeta sp. DS3sAY3a]|nr:hypothetical protein IQ07DRAFT_503831 [Pyrenochaeta sp. DS3sAY3a]
MVFRGKPSKACERCRERRLRCNFHRPSCGGCQRARVACSGYRDTETIRIKDQTDFVTSKVTGKSAVVQIKPNVTPPRLRHLPQDLQALGRDMFFAYYVADFSRTWEFVYQYLDPSTSPEHVSLGIDAASLAFLAHQVSSQTAHEMSRRKYGEALRKINKVLQNPESAKASSTFEAVLLLDLFEKIMKSSVQLSASRHAHIEGALALVKLRGVESFTEGAELKALMGFTLDATICALTTGRYIPQVIRDIRVHAAPFVDTSYPKWKLGGIMLAVCDLGAEMRCGLLTSEERISRCQELDQQLKKVGLEAGPAWHYDRKVSVTDTRATVPDGFFPLYDIYPNRTITQMWNTLRLTRILLCEEIIASCASSSNPDSAAQSEEAELALIGMIREICASVPQMTNCDYAALHKLSRGAQTGPGAQHTHTMSHNFDVYVLIFSLYIVAWARHCPPAAHDWAIKQLHHIADHFGIKEAALILDILETQEHIQPWSAFRALGSSAFAAA